VATLARAHAIDRLSLAGPLLPFDEATARAAAEALAAACWFLVDHTDKAAAIEAALTLPPPRTAEAILAADLTLRYLPGIYDRARARSPSDPLTTALARLLRQWPLAGVLARIDDAPLTPPTFPHAGLQLRYAERFATRPRPGWEPQGRSAEWYELLRAERSA
jgi:hypothetical protein